MTKLEFKCFANNYKIFKDFVKESFKSYNCGEVSFFYFKDGKLFVENEDGMCFDLTKEVIAELMPDDLIF